MSKKVKLLRFTTGSISISRISSFQYHAWGHAWGKSRKGIICSIKCKLLPLAITIFQLNNISNDKMVIFIIIPIHSEIIYILLVIFSLKKNVENIPARKRTTRKLNQHIIVLQSNLRNQIFTFIFILLKENKKQKKEAVQ